MRNQSTRLAVVAALMSAALSGTAASERQLVTVRMSIDEDPIVIRLAESLGSFEQEGLNVVKVDLERLGIHDYLIQEPLVKGQIDAAYHWFNHAIYGARHGFPIRALMLFNDAPGMTILVANGLKDQIRSAADFKGKRVAEGAGYGTKSVITNYLATKAGLPPGSYTPVMTGKEGRQQAVISGLKQGGVDVMTFQEPVTSALLGTGMVSTLYELNSRESTSRVLGAPFPAQSLLMSPGFIQGHPETAQHLVNALVRSMRFINAHGAEEIAAKLPADYFAGKNRDAEIRFIRNTLSTYAKGDYSIAPTAVQLAISINLSSNFDQSVEGRWRASGDKSRVSANELYTNAFVNKAMQQIH